jgi:hypothetical protein
MASHNKPIVTREGSTIVFRASSFGSCVKALAASLAGIEGAAPPAKLQKAFDAGHEAEGAILQTVSDEYGIEVIHQDLTVEYWDENFLWRGHIDGALHLPDRYLVVDAKNLGPSYTKSFLMGGMANMGDLGKKYATQALVYCYATLADGFVIAVRAKEDGHVYTEEYDLEQLRDISGLNKRAMKKKARLVEQIAKDADFLNAPCESEVFGCPYFFLHDGNMGGAMFLDDLDISPVDDEIVNGLVNAKRVASDKLKEAEAAKKASDEALKAWIAQRAPLPEELDGTESTKKAVEFQHVTLDGIKVTRYRGSHSGLDHEALERDGIDLNKYKKPSYNVQVRITGGKKNDG